MSITWNDLDEWKKKAIILFTASLLNFPGLFAQRPQSYQTVQTDQFGVTYVQSPQNYQTVPADQLDAFLAQQNNRNTNKYPHSAALAQQNSRNTNKYPHPAAVNRAAYRQTGQDVYILDSKPCVYDPYYSSGINPCAITNGLKLTGVYIELDQYGDPEDKYLLTYQSPSGKVNVHHVSGQSLRNQFEKGQGGFYPHPEFNLNRQRGGHYHGRYPTRAGEVIHGVGEVIDGFGRIINATRGHRR